MTDETKSQLLDLLRTLVDKQGVAVLVPSLHDLPEEIWKFMNANKLYHVFGAYDENGRDVFRAGASTYGMLHVINVPIDHEAVLYMRQRLRYKPQWEEKA